MRDFFDAARLAESLRGAKQTAPGSWQACCPAHQDKTPSLSIRDAEGRTLIHCFAGCSPDAVLDAMGLRMADLFRDGGGNGRNGRRTEFRSASQAARIPAKPAPGPAKPTRRTRFITERRYMYRDADGFPVAEKLRGRTVDAETGEILKAKDFRCRNARTGEWSLRDLVVPPYRLPEWVHGHRAVVCEGEKDADTLAALGHPATTCIGGAGSWPGDREWNSWFTCTSVLIVWDNDGPGRRHARDVARKVGRFADEVRFLTLPEYHEGMDVSAWLSAGAEQ